MEVNLRNKVTGEIKSQKIGWSWTCFFFSPFLGIPLFLRGLNVWGGVMLFVWGIVTAEELVLERSPSPGLGITHIEISLALVELGLSVFFGVASNRMAGKNYLESGWEFAEPNSETVAAARQAWGLPPI